MKLTQAQLTQLAQIATNHTYINATGEPIVSQGGVIEVIKMYEYFKSL